MKNLSQIFHDVHSIVEEVYQQFPQNHDVYIYGKAFCQRLRHLREENPNNLVRDAELRDFFLGFIKSLFPIHYDESMNLYVVGDIGIVVENIDLMKILDMELRKDADIVHIFQDFLSIRTEKKQSSASQVSPVVGEFVNRHQPHLHRHKSIFPFASVPAEGHPAPRWSQRIRRLFDHMERCERCSRNAGICPEGEGLLRRVEKELGTEEENDADSFPPPAFGEKSVARFRVYESLAERVHLPPQVLDIHRYLLHQEASGGCGRHGQEDNLYASLWRALLLSYVKLAGEGRFPRETNHHARERAFYTVLLLRVLTYTRMDEKDGLVLLAALLHDPTVPVFLDHRDETPVVGYRSGWDPMDSRYDIPVPPEVEGKLHKIASEMQRGICLDSRAYRLWVLRGKLTR